MSFYPPNTDDIVECRKCHEEVGVPDAIDEGADGDNPYWICTGCFPAYVKERDSHSYTINGGESDDDPSPYCGGCHAQTPRECKCGPIAKND